MTITDGVAQPNKTKPTHGTAEAETTAGHETPITADIERAARHAEGQRLAEAVRSARATEAKAIDAVLAAHAVRKDAENAFARWSVAAWRLWDAEGAEAWEGQ